MQLLKLHLKISEVACDQSFRIWHYAKFEKLDEALLLCVSIDVEGYFSLNNFWHFNEYGAW